MIASVSLREKAPNLGDTVAAMAESIGHRIRRVRGTLTQAEFGKRLGVTGGAVSNWERNDGIKAENLILISREFEVTLEWLTHGHGADPDQVSATERISHSTDRLPFARVVGEIGGGGWLDTAPPWGLPVDTADSDRYPPVPFTRDRYEGVRHFALRVVGPSMNRIIPDGAFVICVPYYEVRAGIADGDIAAVELRRSGQYQGTIKRIRRIGIAWELHPESHNPNHQSPIRFDDGLAHDRDNPDVEVVISGLVVGWYVPHV